MSKRVLKQTDTLAVVKVWGTGSTDTISLATDLLSPTAVINGTPKVNISHVTWGVTPGASDQVTVTRNSVPVFNLYQNGQFDLSGNGGWAEDTENTSNIVVTFTGTGFLYLTLRKAAGYQSKVEPEYFGQYDNPTAVGS